MNPVLCALCRCLAYIGRVSAGTGLERRETEKVIIKNSGLQKGQIGARAAERENDDRGSKAGRGKTKSTEMVRRGMVVWVWTAEKR